MSSGFTWLRPRRPCGLGWLREPGVRRRNATGRASGCGRMRSLDVRSWATAGAIGSAIIGLAASLSALVDDLGGLPAFCAETGCEVVRTSVWARPLGVPMSVLGVGFFAA